MLKHRIIPCVLLKNWQLVKSIQFGAYRTIGHPTATVRVYNARNVDELIVLDIDASLNDEPINTEIITDIANECFMPLTIGGGIKTLEDVYTVLNAGADKIAINSKAITNPSFIREIATVFGSQCVVASIDIKKVDGKYHVYNKKMGVLEIDPIALAKEYEAQGAGEILLTSVDHDGTASGYDYELLKLFRNQINIPIIINGGMGMPEHGIEALTLGADALAAAYIFHFSKFTPQMIKESLHQHGITVRL
jgi:imidazole glycerol-phosphate synthase subunit HisF